MLVDATVRLHRDFKPGQARVEYLAPDTSLE
jgi:hypothetical protein